VLLVAAAMHMAYYNGILVSKQCSHISLRRSSPCRVLDMHWVQVSKQLSGMIYIIEASWFAPCNAMRTISTPSQQMEHLTVCKISKMQSPRQIPF
jgi:hypothetical protein